MNSEQFISVVKKVVRESAIEDTIANLEDPPGRSVSESERNRSTWFNELSDDQRNMIENIINDAVDEALFGMFCVLDGTRAIESNCSKNKLVLMYKGQEEKILNNPEEIYLHDLYNAKE